MTTADLVVLLDADDRPCGTAPRTEVHHAHTPRHLAFSSYLFNVDGQVLLTRRSLAKTAWPGVWTNSCCGHPRPAEEPLDAVRRRVHDELGVAIEEPRLILPDFGYRAVDASGVVENEFCPVWIAQVSQPVQPDPGEIAEFTWLPWAELVRLCESAPALLSPWCVAQVPLLAERLERMRAA